MNCIRMHRIERRLPPELGGNHTSFCTYCLEEATRHANVGYWCGNVCAKHAKKFKPSEVEPGVFVVRDLTRGSGAVAQ